MLTLRVALHAWLSLSWLCTRGSPARGSAHVALRTWLTARGSPTRGSPRRYGPRAFASNLWVNEWLATFTEPVRALGKQPPLVLTRGVWAGGQRHGVVLWSSDIWSDFQTLASMVPQGVHASMSGIP